MIYLQNSMLVTLHTLSWELTLTGVSKRIRNDRCDPYLNSFNTQQKFHWVTQSSSLIKIWMSHPFSLSLKGPIDQTDLTIASSISMCSFLNLYLHMFFPSNSHYKMEQLCHHPTPTRKLLCFLWILTMAGLSAPWEALLSTRLAIHFFHIFSRVYKS